MATNNLSTSDELRTRQSKSENTPIPEPKSFMDQLRFLDDMKVKRSGKKQVARPTRSEGPTPSPLPQITGTNILEWDNNTLREQMRLRNPEWGQKSELEQDNIMRQMRTKATAAKGVRTGKPEDPNADAVGRFKSRVLGNDPGQSVGARIVGGLGDLMIPGSYTDLAVLGATSLVGGPEIGVGAQAGWQAGKGVVKNLATQAGRMFNPSRLVKDAAKRVGTAAVVGGAGKALEGGSALEGALEYGGGQTVGEIGTGVVRARHYNEIAKDAIKALDTAREARAAKIADDKTWYETAKAGVKKAAEMYNEFNKSMFNAVSEADKMQVAHEMRHATEVAADGITQHYKKEVGAWKKYPDGEKGLMEMVYGKGPEDLSKMFDTGLKNAYNKAKGHDIVLQVEHAAKMGVKTRPIEGGVQGYVFADMGDVVKALPGKYKVDREMYFEIADRLAKAGVGNQKAVKAYRAGKSVIDQVQKNNLMEGGFLHPDRVLKSLSTGEGNIQPVRGRGQGDYFRGPFAGAAQVKPGETPVRVKPPEVGAAPEVPDVLPRPEPKNPRLRPGVELKDRNVAWKAVPPLATGLAALGEYATTGHYPHAAMIAGNVAGLGAGLAIPTGKQVATKAPISKGAEAAYRGGAATVSQAARELANRGPAKKLREQIKRRYSQATSADDAAREYAQAR